MLNALISSKTRIKLLLKFFLNPGTSSYLRELASEFGDSTNSVRLELNRLTEADLLCSESEGRIIKYKANINHALFNDIKSIVHKYAGIDAIIETVIKKLGYVETAYLIGDYAVGIDSGLIDIILVGKINRSELDRIAERHGKNISRKIRTMVLTLDECHSLWGQLKLDQGLLIWGKAITKK
tara:strand:+ start:2781 stop:3326 length:546 start_codon:yes stop_codon:yes gene_type:complete